MERIVNIFAVPHSHNDAGWLKTYDEYYDEMTKPILDHVTNLLINGPTRKFNWADISFFHKWWNEQTPEYQEKVRNIIDEERFVFIGAGWVMNDEALVNYKQMTLQMRLTLDWLNSTFGVRPTFGWQIDPFGLSSVTISVLYKLGYEGVVGNRISQYLKNQLAEKYGFNFYWKGHQVTRDPQESTILAHILQKHYGLGLNTLWSEEKVTHSKLVNFDEK